MTMRYEGAHDDCPIEEPHDHPGNNYTHLRTWLRYIGGDSLRLDLWDTSDVENGKHRLRYAFAIIPEDLDVRPTVFDGEDYRPSPLYDLTSDETAGALLDFLATYGERLIAGDEDVPEYTWRQRAALIAYHDDIAMWSHELDPQP